VLLYGVFALPERIMSVHDCRGVGLEIAIKLDNGLGVEWLGGHFSVTGLIDIDGREGTLEPVVQQKYYDIINMSLARDLGFYAEAERDENKKNW
jgi:hypothetical protein